MRPAVLPALAAAAGLGAGFAWPALAAPQSSPPCDHAIAGWFLVTDPPADLKTMIEHDAITTMTGLQIHLRVLSVSNIRADPALSDARHFCRADVVTDKGSATYTYWYERVGFGQTAIHAVARWTDFDPNR